MNNVGNKRKKMFDIYHNPSIWGKEQKKTRTKKGRLSKINGINDKWKGILFLCVYVCTEKGLYENI